MTDPSSSPSFWGLRALCVVLLGVAYFAAWQPARSTLVQSVAGPVLDSVSASSASALTVEETARSVRVRFSSNDTVSRSVTVDMPAGIRFLVPALFLVAFAPTRAYWLLLWSGHLLLFVVIVAATSGMIAFGDSTLGAFSYRIAHFTQGYLIDIISLIVPVLAFIQEKKSGLQAVLDE